ncbi:hypothetical protein [Nannocystis punicea]|uniref:Uncharacterized protein n=1 Tax=Nannocystis punicea TaxID=2995304 RepID=A0ABY7H576_9BACT|nr:hypothetical protein [Nannocystis poenicansa]WAS94342.1 hypothetical protein O0S08_50115 [Nannocystis poenicansa]
MSAPRLSCTPEVVSMRARLAACTLAVVAACSPKDPGDGTSEGGSTTTTTQTTGDPTTTTETPTSSTTTQASTEPASSTTDATSSSTTSTTDPLSPCSWDWPEFQGLHYCPAPMELAVPLTGMTPAGPRTFRFAMFGLQGCYSCYSAESPAITFYTEAPGDEPEIPAADHLRLEWFESTDPQGWARLDGGLLGIGPDMLTLELTSVPGLDETSPPLDEAAPPILSGSFSIQGDGWDLAGSFDATLCSELLWFISCE